MPAIYNYVINISLSGGRLCGIYRPQDKRLERELCNSDSLCCIARSEDLHSQSLIEPDVTCDAHLTKPKWSTISLPWDIKSDAYQTEPEWFTISLR